MNMSNGNQSTNYPASSIQRVVRQGTNEFRSLLHKNPEPETPEEGISDGIPKEWISKWMWVEFDRIQSWLRHCDTNHEDQCRGFQTSRSGQPLKPRWLIDVVKSCIVPYEDADYKPYVSLSYVWGSSGTTFLELNASTLSMLRQPGSIQREANQIPDTILTAITVTFRLSFQYLWVDRLCIVQDDAATKHSQINHMAGIYSSSSLTIIATEPATQPLWGVKPLDGMSCGRLGMRQMPWTWSFAARLKDSSWNKRAWTFQELLFSRRAIVFFQNELHCICHCEESEYRHLLSKPKKTASSAQQLLGPYQFSGWPDMDTYTSIVTDYAQRKVTFEVDVLHAFAGLSTALSPCFSGIHYGLPEIFFDIGLLWYPACSSNPFRPGRDALPLWRRKPPPDANTGANSLPSWSWMGWQGSFDFWYWRTVNTKFVATRRSSNGRPKQPPITTNARRPLVEWYVITTGADTSNSISAPDPSKTIPISPATRRSTRPIQANLHAYTQSHLLDHSKSLCWSQTQQTYHHPSDPSTPFQHPIPIFPPSLDQSCASPHSDQTPTSILHFKARESYFCLPSSDNPVLTLPSDTSKAPLTIGYLWLHSEAFKKKMHEGDIQWARVIAISEGQVGRKHIKSCEKLFWADQSDRLGSKGVGGGRWSWMVPRAVREGLAMRESEREERDEEEHGSDRNEKSGVAPARTPNVENDENGDDDKSGGNISPVSHARPLVFRDDRGFSLPSMRALRRFSFSTPARVNPLSNLKGRIASVSSSSLGHINAGGDSQEESDYDLRGRLEREVRGDGIVKFYNVLCVDRAEGMVGENDMVERVGIGTVLKSAFDAMALREEKEVRLG